MAIGALFKRVALLLLLLNAVESLAPHGENLQAAALMRATPGLKARRTHLVARAPQNAPQNEVPHDTPQSTPQGAPAQDSQEPDLNKDDSHSGPNGQPFNIPFPVDQPNPEEFCAQRRSRSYCEGAPFKHALSGELIHCWWLVSGKCVAAQVCDAACASATCMKCDSKAIPCVPVQLGCPTPCSHLQSKDSCELGGIAGSPLPSARCSWHGGHCKVAPKLSRYYVNPRTGPSHSKPLSEVSDEREDMKVVVPATIMLPVMITLAVLMLVLGMAFMMRTGKSAGRGAADDEAPKVPRAPQNRRQHCPPNRSGASSCAPGLRSSVHPGRRTPISSIRSTASLPRLPVAVAIDAGSGACTRFSTLGPGRSRLNSAPAMHPLLDRADVCIAQTLRTQLEEASQDLRSHARTVTDVDGEQSALCAAPLLADQDVRPSTPARKRVLPAEL